jgi:hypothetical protein
MIKPTNLSAYSRIPYPPAPVASAQTGQTASAQADVQSGSATAPRNPHAGVKRKRLEESRVDVAPPKKTAVINGVTVEAVNRFCGGPDDKGADRQFQMVKAPAGSLTGYKSAVDWPAHSAELDTEGGHSFFWVPVDDLMAPEVQVMKRQRPDADTPALTAASETQEPTGHSEVTPSSGSACATGSETAPRDTKQSSDSPVGRATPSPDGSDIRSKRLGARQVINDSLEPHLVRDLRNIVQEYVGPSSFVDAASWRSLSAETPWFSIPTVLLVKPSPAKAHWFTVPAVWLGHWQDSSENWYGEAIVVPADSPSELLDRLINPVNIGDNKIVGALRNEDGAARPLVTLRPDEYRARPYKYDVNKFDPAHQLVVAPGNLHEVPVKVVAINNGGWVTVGCAYDPRLYQDGDYMEHSNVREVPGADPSIRWQFEDDYDKLFLADTSHFQGAGTQASDFEDFEFSGRDIKTFDADETSVSTEDADSEGDDSPTSRSECPAPGAQPAVAQGPHAVTRFSTFAGPLLDSAFDVPIDRLTRADALAVLGFASDAQPPTAEVNKAFREASKLFHPDKLLHLPDRARYEGRQQLIVAARDFLLTNPVEL